MKIYKLLFLFLFFAGTFVACTDLEEELREDLPGDEAEKYLKESADVSALISSVYRQMHEPYSDQARLWALCQHTTDETIGPTRGGDWDDNGIWRVLHNHTWDASHDYITQVFNLTLQVVFSTTNVLSFDPSPQDAAVVRFLRAFAMFTVADNYNQVPFRDPGENLLQAPRVLKGGEAIDFIISECLAVIPDLPDGPPNKANKDAARVLLMKCYLNKGTFADRANPSFPSSDMNEVIALADQIINSGKYSLSANFYDNFAPHNDQLSTENIFTFENKPGVGGGNGNSVRSRYFCTLHYNQPVSGWNGFTTLSDFYDKFEASDVRRGADYTGLTDVNAMKAGFLVGQQFDMNGVALQDRNGNPLAFTREINLIETGNDLEIKGIRVVKYIPDLTSGDNVDNDLVFYRYADVLLMKAEALLRSGSAGTALTIVNSVRTARGASMLSALNEQTLLDERGRELYWEGHRRQDLIRFGKFLDPYQLKPQSGPERLLFPIPATALAVNPNLEQNPGY